MKVLALSAVFPDAPSDGDRVRLYGFLERLSARHEVTLLSFSDPARAADAGPTGLKRLAAAHKVPLRFAAKLANAAWRLGSEWPLNAEAYFSRDMEDAVDGLIRAAAGQGRPFDVVHCHRLRMAPYALRFKGPRVLDYTDSLTRYAERRAVGLRLAGRRLRAAWAAREARKLAAFEAWCATQFDAGLMNGAQDAAALKAMAPRGDVRVAANGVAGPGGPRPFKRAARPAEEFVFVGHLAYAPNAEAVLWFAREVLPRVRQSRPGARFTIVGGDAPAALRALKGKPGIALEGFQADTSPYLARAAASVCPVSLAVGRQNKILDALAAGTPVVASGIAAELAEAKPGRHLLAADGAASFAQACLRLLKDPALGRRLARQGMALARQKYDWERNARVVERAWQDAIKKEGRS